MESSSNLESFNIPSSGVDSSSSSVELPKWEAMGDNVIIEILKLNETVDGEICNNVATNKFGRSVNGSMMGILRDIGPGVPAKFSMRLGDLVIVSGYRSVFYKRHYVCVKYKDIIAKNKNARFLPQDVIDKEIEK